jgi:aerobic-type carbon monoxide dehydrogenase small subunit (CoxS/CutS family)
MAKLEKEKTKEGLTRRDFLKDAGLVVGVATVGSLAILNACDKGEAATETVTATSTKTVTAGAGSTVTTTVTVGAGSTVTVAAPTVTKTVETAPSGLYTFKINGKDYQVLNVKPNWSLAYVIREKLGLTGTKRGCDSGDCGVCTLIMDNRPTLSCITLAVEAQGKAIQTIEGLATTDSAFHPIQQAFIDNDAVQCGWCTPACIMTTKALLAKIPKPTEADVREYLAGNLCRCGTYQSVRAAVLSLAK